jgi:hypothetical protein
MTRKEKLLILICGLFFGFVPLFLKTEIIVSSVCYLTALIAIISVVLIKTKKKKKRNQIYYL